MAIEAIGNKPHLTEYNPIKTSGWACVFAILSLSLYLYYQYCKLETALQNGQMDEAEKRVKNGGWFFYDVTKERLSTLKLEPIKFIVAQILFNKEDPNGGNPDAKAVLEARDDLRNLKVLQALSYAQFPRTISSNKRAFSFGDGDEILVDTREFCPFEKGRIPKKPPSFSYISSSRVLC